MGNKLKNIKCCGDCLKIMKTLPDESFDLLLTDPPYKIRTAAVRVIDGDTTDRLKKRWVKSNPDLIRTGKFVNNIPKFKDWLPDCYRLLKPGTHAYIFTSGEHIEEIGREAKKAGFKYQNLLMWVKNNKTPNNWYMKQAEFILMLRKGPAKPVNNRGISTVLNFKNVTNKIHPTQKPIKLLKLLIEQSTNPGDIVFDPFAGSFSTMKAAQECGRNSYSIEMEEKYVLLFERE